VILAGGNGRLHLVSCPRLLAELAATLAKPHLARRLATRGMTIRAALATYASAVEIVDDIPVPPTILRDPDDDHVLACALCARADVVVSGDADLLALRSFEGIPIMTARDLLALIGRA
jgi:putative PIN family toxin of toxin-antitoxin system